MDITPALIQQCAPQVAPQTVAAVIRTESGGNPLAININYKKARLARRPANRIEAIGWAKWLIQHGYNIDMGLMQVNSQHLPRLGLSVESLFEPCTNMRVGSDILTKNYLKARTKYGSGQHALYASLSAYNTGHFERGFRNGYVNRVYNNAGKPIVVQYNPNKSKKNHKSLTENNHEKYLPQQYNGQNTLASNAPQTYNQYYSPKNANTAINTTNNSSSSNQTFAFVR